MCAQPTVGDASSRQVVLGSIRKAEQAMGKPATEQQPSQSRASRFLPCLSLGPCPAFLQGRTRTDCVSQTGPLLTCLLWSWCSVTAIETLVRTEPHPMVHSHSQIKPNICFSTSGDGGEGPKPPRKRMRKRSIPALTRTCYLMVNKVLLLLCVTFLNNLYLKSLLLL